MDASPKTSPSGHHSSMGRSWAARARASLLVVVIACLLGVFRVTVDGDPVRLVGAESPRYDAYLHILEHFPGEQHQLMIVSQASAFNVAHLEAYRIAHKSLASMPSVSSVASLFSQPSLARALNQIIKEPETSRATGLTADVEALLTQTDFTLSRFVSAEQDALLMVLQLDPNADEAESISTINNALATIYERVGWTMVGQPVLEIQLREDVLREILWVTGLAILFGSVAIGWVLLSWRDVFDVLCAPICATLCTLGILGWLSIPITLLTQAVLIIVFLVVFTDTLHSFYGRRSKRSLILACALTSFTTAVAAVSLLFSTAVVMQEFGQALLVGIATGFIIWLLWLASSFTPKNRDNARLFSANKVIDSPYSSNSRITSQWILIVLLMALLISASQLKTEFSLYENIPRAHSLSSSIAISEKKFQSFLPLQFSVSRAENGSQGYENSDTLTENPLNNVEQFVDQIRQFQAKLNNLEFAVNDEKLHWYSVQDLLSLAPGFNAQQRLQALPETLRSGFWHDVHGTVLHAPISVDSFVNQSNFTINEIDQSIATLASEHNLTASLVTGFPALVHDAKNDLLPEAAKTLLLTLLVMLVLVTLIYRSVKPVVVVMGIVCFTMLSFAAALELLGEPVRHAGIVFGTLLVGLSVDNGIHLVFSQNNESRLSQNNIDSHLSTNADATERCLAILWLSTLVLVTGFIALTVSAIPSLTVLGLAAACALAMGFLAASLFTANTLSSRFFC